MKYPSVQKLRLYMEDESAHARRTRHIQSKVSVPSGHFLDYDAPVWLITITANPLVLKGASLL